jgi:site-specific DNA-methyltransferase (adenine-specific)
MDGYDPIDDRNKAFALVTEHMRERLEKSKVVIGDCTLYNDDCLDVMSGLPKGSISSIITDPPYCSGAATEANKGAATHQGLRSESIRSGERFSWFGSDNMTTAGLVWLLRAVAVQGDRLTDAGGSLLAFCDWRMAINLAPAMESGGWRLRNLCIWNKGHFGLGTGFRPQHEMIIHLTKRAPAFHHMGYGNVLDCPRTERLGQEHPTQKPIGLMRALVEVTAPSGGTVLDPFMGSGTTGVACVKLGRKFIGIEKDTESGYFDIACRRIEEAYAQGDLFVASSSPQPEQLTLDA